MNGIELSCSAFDTRVTMDEPEWLDFEGLDEYDARQEVLRYINGQTNIRGIIAARALLDAVTRGWERLTFLLLERGARADIHMYGDMALSAAALMLDPIENEALFQAFRRIPTSLDGMWSDFHLGSDFVVGQHIDYELGDDEVGDVDENVGLMEQLMTRISSMSYIGVNSNEPIPIDIAQRDQYIKWLLAFIGRPNFFHYGKLYLTAFAFEFSNIYSALWHRDDREVWMRVMSAILQAGSAWYEKYIDREEVESFYEMTLRENDIENAIMALSRGYSVNKGDLLWGVVHGSKRLFRLLLENGADPRVTVRMIDGGQVILDLSNLKVGQLNRLVRDIARKHVSSLQLYAGLAVSEEGLNVDWMHPFQLTDAGLYDPDEEV